MDETLIHSHHDGVLRPTVRPGTPPDFILKVRCFGTKERKFCNRGMCGWLEVRGEALWPGCCRVGISVLGVFVLYRTVSSSLAVKEAVCTSQKGSYMMCSKLSLGVE